MNSLKSEIKNILSHYTIEFHLNYDIIIAQVKIESNFNPKAISKSEQMGLFQIKQFTFNDIKERLQPIFNIDLRDNIDEINTNIKQGCAYMRWLLTNFEESYFYALLQYNQGIGKINKVKKWRETKEELSGEAVEYVYKIFKEAGICQYL